MAHKAGGPVTYRRDMGAIHDRIVARERRHSEERAAQRFRRICSFCKRDLGPAPADVTPPGHTHGACLPPCKEAIALGWGEVLG